MDLFGRIKVKETLRISKKDLIKLLTENQRMQRQIVELQEALRTVEEGRIKE